MAINILMVCLGNICRSPLAEGILRHKVEPNQVFVDSAGTGGYHIGNTPDKRSIAVASKYGLDISHQRCRQVTRGDFEKFDIIYAMDRNNYSNLIQMAQNADQISKVRLLLEEVSIGTSEVPDPYYGGKDGFEKIFTMINDACEAVALRLENKNKN